MFEADALRAAVLKAKPFFPEIQGFYRYLPETRCVCDRPGACCIYLPEMTLIEALQRMDILLGMEAPQRFGILNQFVAFYLVTPLRIIWMPVFNGWDVFGLSVSAFCMSGLWIVESEDGKMEDAKKQGRPKDTSRPLESFRDRVSSRVHPPGNRFLSKSGMRFKGFGRGFDEDSRRGLSAE